MKRTAILTIVAALAVADPSAASAQEASAAAKAKAKADAERTRVIIEQRERREEQQRREEQRRQERRDDQRAEQTETVSRSVRVGSQGELDLHNMSGSVTVTRGSGNELKIDAVKKARAATDEAAREMLQLVKIEISERAGRVEVRTQFPHSERPRRGEHRNVSVSVAYNITAPAATRVRINSMSGHINVSDISGELALEAMSGHITIERAARVLAAKTMSGNVTISETKSDGLLNAGTMSGDVTLKQVNARQINAEVISGTISMIDVESDRVGASTTSGDVVFEGKLARSGRYKFDAHSGNIKVALMDDTGFELDADSWGGSVRSELTLKNTEQRVGDFPRRARAGGGTGGRTRALKGTYGDGSAVLDLTTFSGTITITKRVTERR